MKRDELKAMLADYLGDELSSEQRQQFESALVNDSEFADEVEGLKQTLQTIHSLDEPVTTKKIPIESARPVVIPGLLRYAAVLAIAFIGGYMARGPQSVQLQNDQQSTHNQSTSSTTSDWQLKFAKRYLEHPSDSSLARSLVALARSSD